MCTQYTIIILTDPEITIVTDPYITIMPNLEVIILTNPEIIIFRNPAELSKLCFPNWHRRTRHNELHIYTHSL